MGTVTLREAGPADLPLIQTLGCQSYTEHFGYLWQPAGLRSYLQQQFSTEVLETALATPHEQAWLLARVDNSCVGFARVNWAAADPVSGRIGAELQKIYLLRQACGQGFGQMIMDGVQARAARRTEWIWLDVVEQNFGARRFYQRNGFRLIGRMPMQTDMREVRLLVMGREFPSP